MLRGWQRTVAWAHLQSPLHSSHLLPRPLLCTLQKLEGRCRKDGPCDAFSRLDHTEVPALREHVHDIARRRGTVVCPFPPAVGRCVACTVVAAHAQCTPHLVHAHAPPPCQPTHPPPPTRLPPSSFRGRIHAARSLASSISAFVVSTALLLRDQVRSGIRG